MLEPASDGRVHERRWWIALQIAAIVPLMWAVVVVAEMTFAMPGRGYHDASGKYIACEALAARGKPYTAPRCATYGSMETNPIGYAGAFALLVALSSVLWVSTRPGRGLRFSRARG